MYLCGKRYKVTGRLGEGGFGSVYLAEDTLLGNTWAVKEIGNSDEISYSSIKAEISVLSRTSHPGIVRITDVFRSEGHVYIVMDHVPGKNLKEILKSKKRIPEKILFRWCAELCDAVSYLHNMDPPVILCDIKPQNIMVRPDGHITLIDFGAALYGNAKDSPSFASRKYASPEQLAGCTPDIKSDIYSLGRVIDEMTGKNKPFGINAVIARCTVKDPRFRYRSANAVRRDIRIAGHTGTILICLVILLISGTFMIMNARKSTEEINNIAMAQQSARQSYEQGLLCFYELDDYKAAENYLSEVPLTEYPEASYYIELSKMLSDGSRDPTGIYSKLVKFDDFNEKTIKGSDNNRYIKNAFCLAKVYISEDNNVNSLEKAYELSDRVLSLCNDDPALSQYREDALRLMINISILKGRADPKDMTEKYHQAVGLIETLISMPSVCEDKGCVIAKRMDEASLYTELGEYDIAIRVYEETEKDYPYDPEINYLAHLSLLLQTDAAKSEILSLWADASKVEGIESSSNYELLKERMDALQET